MAKHRNDWKNGLILGRNKEIVKDINQWYIELFENYPCNNIEELTQREGQIIIDIGTLNKNMMGNVGKEYHKEKVKNKVKIYRKEMNDNVKIYRKEINDDLKKTRIENAKKYNEIKTRIENEYNDFIREMDEKEAIYKKEQDENMKETDKMRKINREKREQEQINKKELNFKTKNLKGVIYTREQLEKICLKNNIKIQSVMYKMRLKLSKIENLLIPEDL